MKTMYKQSTESLHQRYNRPNKDNGLTSLLYFLLMAAILFSMLFMPDKIHAASDIQLGAQITDTKNFSGILSGRFLKDFEASDIYFIAYPASSTVSFDNLFSLVMVEKEHQELVWKNQLSMLSTYNCIKSGDWGVFSPIDFNPIKNQLAGGQDLIILLLLVKQGSDPLNSSNWYGIAETSLITNPGQRVPGQTLFASEQKDYRYYPADVADEDKTPDNSAPEYPDEAEKPDIYKISGSKLFYANGSSAKFQVVDIANPYIPTLIHSESLQNTTPLDLYINNEYIILLEQMSEKNNVSVILQVFSVQGDIIRKVAEQAYTDMQYTASRRSGDRIFITGTVPNYYTYGVDNIANDNTNSDDDKNKLLVAAIDISEPDVPQLLSKKKLEGYDSDIYLNSDYLVQIANESWDTTILHLFDLHNDDLLNKICEIRIPGKVPSEYHVNIENNRLFVIYRDQDIRKGSSLKVFDIHSENLAETGAIEEKGSVNGIAPGEDLFGATFIDNRAYIVTYEKKDPLWVVDISDSLAPRIIGELEVPGWSEYIRFYNNRLIALGYDDSDGNRRVSVAIFSVQDPLNPRLLDRVTPLSDVSPYTSSIAIDDDRAFYWNRSSGIIIIPINYYTDTNHSGLEIIHVDSDWNSFKRADFISADFNVQRGTEADDSDSMENLQNIVLSMGDAALNTINVSSEQKPVILGKLRLAYNVEKIAPYESDVSQEIKSIFALGGDFYTNSTSDLMMYDNNETGGFDFTAPDKMAESELLYPELVTGSKSFGVILSWSSSAFRLFDQESMKMGQIVKLGDISGYNIYDPIISDQTLYFALSKYSYIEFYDSEEIDHSYVRSSYAINTTLKRYRLSDINTPEELPEISIPGIPKAIFNDTRLVTAETTYRYYYPYYMYDVQNTPVESFIPPDLPETPQGTRINAVELETDLGVLDKTAFFDEESYGYSEVICDEDAIYLVSVKDEQTYIHQISPETLNIINTFNIKGSFLPVNAKKGNILLTSSPYYPYWRYNYEFIPYWNSNDIKVVDISKGVLKEIFTLSSDLYISKNNTVLGSGGFYIANGYRGIVYFPFNR